MMQRFATSTMIAMWLREPIQFVQVFVVYQRRCHFKAAAAKQGRNSEGAG